MVTLLLLAAVEGLLRIPAIQQVLPARTHYYDAGIAVREDALRRTLNAHGRVDVLFVGSSIVRTNIQPLTFDGMVQGRTGEPIVSFNAGLSGLWPEAVALYLENVWLPLAKPRLVIQGIRCPELSETTPALEADRLGKGTIEAAWMEGGWPTRAQSAAVAHLRLLQYRGALVDVLKRYLNGRPGPVTTSEREFAIDSRGYTPRLPTLREARSRGVIKDEGLAGTVCTDGCRIGFAALRRAVAAARRSGAEYILVNIPEHGTRWRGEEGRSRYQEYLALLRTFAQAERVRLVDPTDGYPYAFQNDEEYSDTYHMSPAGATRLTSILAARIDTRTLRAGHDHRSRRVVGTRASLPW